MHEDQPKEEGAEVLAPDQVRFLIPECCREGWDTCPHTVKREKPKRGNIAI